MKKLILTLGLALVAFAASPQPGEKLAKDQTLIFNAGAAPVSLDPAKIEGTVEGVFARNLFETLIITDDEDRPIPGAAASWSHSEDFRTWTFKLQPNAKWSDGSPVTAGDFVYAWRRLADPKVASPYASYLTYLRLENAEEIIAGKRPVNTLGVEATGPLTLVLHLSQPVPFVDSLVQLFIMAPVPQKLVERLGDSWAEAKNLVSNGAYKIDELVLNEEAKLSKNPYYWDAANVRLERVRLAQIPNASVEFNRYRAGELDVAAFPYELVEAVKKDYAGEFVSGTKFCTYFFGFNNAKAPFNDPRVRRALSMSLDRQIITEKILKMGQVPAYNFTPPAMGAAEKITPPEWANWDMKRRNAEALRLLAEAGFDKDHPLNFQVLYQTNDNDKKTIIAAAAIWKQNLAGVVDLGLKNQEWKSYVSTRRLGEYEVAMTYWCYDYNDASSFLNAYLSDSSNNKEFFKSAEFDRAIADAYLAKSEEERAGFYARAEAILAEAAAIAPVYFDADALLVKPYVRGLRLKPSLQLYFKNIYILEH